MRRFLESCDARQVPPLALAVDHVGAGIVVHLSAGSLSAELVTL